MLGILQTLMVFSLMFLLIFVVSVFVGVFADFCC